MKKWIVGLIVLVAIGVPTVLYLNNQPISNEQTPGEGGNDTTSNEFDERHIYS